MNTTYLLLTLFVIILTIFCWWKTSARSIDVWDVVAAVCTGIDIIMIALSFAGGAGAPLIKHFPITPSSMELTPYRLIVQADGKEWVFKDALSVVKATQKAPSSVTITYQRNAWGITHETGPALAPKAELVWDGAGR
jgi:hypothetical protein